MVSDCFLASVALALASNKTLTHVDVMPPPTSVGMHALALAVRDSPRHGALSFEAFEQADVAATTFFLHDIAGELGLPEGAEMLWDDKLGLRMLHENHAAKCDAFAMGLHPRLGGDSQVGNLLQSTDCIGMILHAYWGPRFSRGPDG